jgi:nicotinate-nucleotide pyrophosphorylase (carboxylating)
MQKLIPPPTEAIEEIVDRALAEDLPDITSDSIFDASDAAHAYLLAREEGVLAGLPFARAVFASLDSSATFDAAASEGSRVAPGDVIARIRGPVRALLAGERTALNLLQRAAGIATSTRRYVDAVEGTKAKIYDTRKTAPGLRALDKYAVRAGGGENHRYGLMDMVLIKNNHIDRAGSIRAAVSAVRSAGRQEKVMVEVRTMVELEEALAMEPDFILLDNMTPDALRASVERVAGAVPLEASGGVTLDSVRTVAECGVDRISVGALTHSARALDISMRIEPPA